MLSVSIRRFVSLAGAINVSFVRSCVIRILHENVIRFGVSSILLLRAVVIFFSASSSSSSLSSP